MVNAARATGRVVQVGTHRRISPHNVSGRDFIRSGKVGEIGMVRCFVQLRRRRGTTRSRPSTRAEGTRLGPLVRPRSAPPYNGGDPRDPSRPGRW
jgi:predicted dehydrogenase